MARRSTLPTATSIFPRPIRWARPPPSISPANGELVLVAVDAAALGPALKWEPSRGGALFPHLHGDLPLALVAWVRPLPLGADGRHLFPPL